MTSYLVKRLIFLIPALLFALVITFFLTTLSSPYASSWEEDDRDRRHPRKIYQDHLQQIKAKSAHLPVFYFSMMPRSYRWTMEEVDPQIKKVKRSYAQVCDDQAAGDFFSLIDAHLDTISSSRDCRSLMALKSSSAETIIQFITQSNLPQPEYWLNEAEKVLATEPTMAGSLPSFSWHGSQNRFHKWITHFVTGNWGTSIVDGRPVISKIWSALVWTLGLSIMTIVAGLGLSFLAAIFGLKKEGSLGQRAVHTALMALYAMPLFWIATIAIVFLTTPQYSAWLNIFPSVGIFNPPSSAGFGRTLIELISFIFLPMLCMVLSGMAFLYLQWLENGRSVQSMPFVITARSKGLNMDQVVRKHIMPNASIPVIGLIGLMLPAVISGSVIIEVLFNIPGMGRLIFTSVMTQDWDIVFAVVFITSVLSFLGLALSDLLMHYYDPKIRVDE